VGRRPLEHAGFGVHALLQVLVAVPNHRTAHRHNTDEVLAFLHSQRMDVVQTELFEPLVLGDDRGPLIVVEPQKIVRGVLARADRGADDGARPRPCRNRVT
jgi:hypothetical protein